MTRPSIVFLDSATLDHGDLDLHPLERLGKLARYPLTQPHEIGPRVHGAEIVLANKTKIDAEVLAAATYLKLIGVCATGTNNVDLEAARKQGIRVCNVTGYSNFSVAQHAITFMLNWATQMHRYVAETKEWAESPMFTRLDHSVIELHGRTLGLVGTGRIGSEVGRLATALGMKVQASESMLPTREEGGEKNRTHLALNPFPRLPLRRLFETSDVISLHCPLTPQTRHLINRKTLGWMKRGAFLVNTSRGDLIDEEALKDSLLDGNLGGAGLDVLSQEPPLAHHVLLDPRIPHLMITPHSAWTSQEARGRLINEMILNIEAFLRGEDRNRVA